MATVYFLELITGMSDVAKDQEHIPMAIWSIPDTPDRTSYILNQTQESPLPNLIQAGCKLKEQGAQYLAIPCVTAHYFYDELCAQIGLPILSLPRELGETFAGERVTKVGILATSGTVESAFLQDALAEYGISCVTPDKAAQEVVMTVIYEQIKAGRRADVDAFLDVGQQLRDAGAQRLLLGCTELSLLKRDFQIPPDYVDALEVLAKAAIQYNGIAVKEYPFRGHLR
jgi:aspartate racemase